MADRSFVGQIYTPSVVWETLRTSPDLRRIAYVSRVDERQRVIVDDTESEPFDGIGMDTIAFSPDSRHVAYVAARNGKQCVVRDEEVMGLYDETLRGAPSFGPGSTRFAYGASRGGRWFAVLDGNEQPGFDRLGGLAFSPDGRHFAYCARKGGRAVLVLDGERAYECEGDLAWPVFSPDSRRLACLSVGESGMFVVVDGRADKRYPHLLERTFSFSPDSAHFAYGVHFGETEAVVRDGFEGPRFRGVLGRLLFSHRNNRLLYAVNGGSKQFMTLDHAPCREFDYMVIGNNDVFSPNDRRFAYVAKQGSWQHVVVDEETGPEFDGIRASSVTFSSDGTHVAYIGRRGRTRFPVCDGEILTRYPEPSFASFLPGGGPLVFSSRADGIESVCVAGEPILECDGVVAPQAERPAILCDSADAFHFLALISGAVYGVEFRAD